MIIIIMIILSELNQLITIIIIIMITTMIITIIILRPVLVPLGRRVAHGHDRLCWLRTNGIKTSGV